MEFTDRMEAGRTAAAARRHSARVTGKSAKGWDYKRPDPAKGSFERVRLAATAQWQAASGLAHEDYLRTVFPERFGDETIDCVIAASRAAEAAALLATF